MNLEALLRSFGEHDVAGFILVLARVGPLFLLAPLFSSRMIPARAKALAAVVLAYTITPVVVHDTQIPLDIWALGGLILKEMIVGMGFAFVLAALFGAITTAGSFLDTFTGFSYGALVDPITGNQTATLSQAYSLVGVAVLIAIGGDQLMIRGFARTYDLVGVLDYPSLNVLVAGAQHAFSGVFLSALELCAPVLLAIVVTDAAFGVVSRVVPQLNVFAVGFPMKVIVGLVMIGVSLPFVAAWIGDELQRSVATALQSVRLA